MRGLLAFLALILLWSLLAEALLRSPLGDFLPPSVGADNFQFDLKTHYLEQFIRRYGRLDCLIVGSSMANSGLDPLIIDQVYTQETGQTLHCFNFGLSALTMASGGDIARALLRRYQPHILIIVLSARDFSIEYGDLTAPLLQTAWVRQNLGQASLEGWLVNYAGGYRYRLALQYWLRPENRAPFLQEYHALTRQGFSPLQEFRDPPVNFPAFVDFSPAQSAWQGFESIQNQPETVVIFVEAPIQPAYRQIYLETPQRYEQRFIQPVQTDLAARNIPFLRTVNLSNSLPADFWYDSLHVNSRGAPVFSRWLGGQLSRLSPQGLSH